MSHNIKLTLVLVVAGFVSCYAGEQDSAQKNPQTPITETDIKTMVEASGNLGQGFQAYLLDGTRINAYNFTKGPMAGKCLCTHWTQSTNKKGESGQSGAYTTSANAKIIFDLCKSMHDSKNKKCVSWWSHGLISLELPLTLNS
jgi:hypothetical protein